MFFYVFPGIASVASFTLATTNGVGAEVGIPVFGSLFQIGWAFAIGIAFAIIVSQPLYKISELRHICGLFLVDSLRIKTSRTQRKALC